jgi:hypothetical protein
MNVLKTYKAAFLIPENAKRSLTENGWEFEANNPIDADVLDSLLQIFDQLQKGEVDTDTYRTEGLIVDVLIEDEKIEQIYIRDYSSEHKNIDLVKSSYSGQSGVEVFIP